MYYEINIALHGQHFFATAPRSLLTLSCTKNLYRILVEKFPPSEGYSITVSLHSTTSHHVVMDV